MAVAAVQVGKRSPISYLLFREKDLNLKFVNAGLCGRQFVREGAEDVLEH